MSGVEKNKDVADSVGGRVTFTQGKQQANIKYLRNSPFGVPCSTLWSLCPKVNKIRVFEERKELFAFAALFEELSKIQLFITCK